MGGSDDPEVYGEVTLPPENTPAVAALVEDFTLEVSERQRFHHLQAESMITDWYPVVIREARYNGAYCGAKFVITVGLFPEQLERIGAFGSDVPCATFWQNVSDGGSFLEFEDSEYFVMAGDDPSNLVEHAKTSIERYNETLKE